MNSFCINYSLHVILLYCTVLDPIRSDPIYNFTRFIAKIRVEEPKLIYKIIIPSNRFIADMLFYI